MNQVVATKAVPLLGQVPESWVVSKLKWALEGMGSGGTPETHDPKYWCDSGTPWVAIGDMSSVDHVEHTKKSLSPAGISSKGLRIWPSGTLLFSMYASLGHVAVLKTPAAINQAILALLPGSRIIQEYLKYWLNALQVHLKTVASSNTQDNLNAEKVGNLPLAFPSIPLQSLIVAHLDHETARIDTLVEKKTRFIALLREKRQALITHAVTKGLDPGVPMKDSGVEWLGRVPENWRITSLKRLGKLKGGCAFPQHHQGSAGNQFPFFKVSDLGKSLDGRHFVSPSNTIDIKVVKEIGAAIFPPGSLAWAKIGAALALNRRRIVVEPSCLDNNMTGFVPDAAIISTRFVFYLMNCIDFGVHAKPGAVPSFSEGDQGQLLVCLPPLCSQNEIISRLDRATARIDTLIAKTERSIELLREHRTALITAAVTGKLDLREAA